MDSSGEDGLTFRALSKRLVTGAGAIYWHITNKGDLLTAACDAIVAPTMEARVTGATPKATIRVLALNVFDAMTLHPWLGSALIQAELHSPIIRILEGIGQQIRTLRVSDEEQWTMVSVLLSYILGVGGQNAAHEELARKRGLDRGHFLETAATAWSQLDPELYPFTRSIVGQLRAHDDRVDFLAGLDLILKGIDSHRSMRPRQ